MTTLELIQYYSDLLILQYKGKPKARASIQALASLVVLPQTSTQEITFDLVATSGSFTLSYIGNSTTTLQWNDSSATIQSSLQALPGLSNVTVTGSIAGQSLVVTFTDVLAPAQMLVVETNSLLATATPVIISIAETDLTLPLAVQDAFNLTGPNPAVGVQLDTLGKYANVTRYGVGFNGQAITLNDTDFLTFIKMAITTNSSGSSLYDIDNLVFGFFAGSILVFDYADMRMSYLISTTVGSSNLIQLFVTENLLPRPMGVQLSIVFAPIIDAFFGFVTYQHPGQPSISRPFNTYDVYNTNWPWLSYSDSFF